MSVRDQYASHRSFTLIHEGHMRITHQHSAALVGFAAMMTLGCDGSTARRKPQQPTHAPFHLRPTT